MARIIKADIVVLKDEHKQAIRVWFANDGTRAGWYWNFSAMRKSDPDNPANGPFQSRLSAIGSAQAFCDMVGA